MTETVLLVVRSSDGTRGGAADEAQRNAARQFAALGGCVDLRVVADGPPVPELASVASDVVTAQMSGAGLALLPARIAHEARRVCAGVVMCEGPSVSDAAVALGARLAGRTCVVRRNFPADYVGEGAASRFLRHATDRAAARLADRLVFVTGSALEREGDPERDAIVPNGVDVTSFRTSAEDARSGDGDAAGSDDGDPVVVTVARFAPPKNWDMFLRTVLELCRRGRTPKAYAIGDGPQREAVRIEAERLHVDGFVEFTGEVADVRPYLAHADVFFLPSYRESMPLACMEALAEGVPVVATPFDGSREVTAEGAAGRVVPQDAPEVAADAVEDLAVEGEGVAAAAQVYLERNLSVRCGAARLALVLGLDVLA